MDLKDLNLGTLSIAALGAGVAMFGGQKAFDGYSHCLWVVAGGTALMVLSDKIGVAAQKALDRLSEGVVNGAGSWSSRI